MRGIGEHTPPATTQPCPSDNTTSHVMSQVRQWQLREANAPRVHPTPYSGLPIHAESAREIAAWWQSPGQDGSAFASFASTGTIRQHLARAIEDTIGAWERDSARPMPVLADENHAESLAALRALLAYVRACTVEVWTVSQGAERDDSERSEVSRYLAWGDAWDDFSGRLESIDVLLFGEQVQCECTEEETCEPCDTQQTANAYLSERTSERELQWSRDGWTIGFAYRPESSGATTVWRIERATMTYGEFLDSEAAGNQVDVRQVV